MEWEDRRRMLSTACLDSRNAGRILANVRARCWPDRGEIIGDPERVLSRPPKVARPKQRTPSWLSRHQTVVELLWLGAIAIGGIAAIIGLRSLGAEYGVIWVSD